MHYYILVDGWSLRSRSLNRSGNLQRLAQNVMTKHNPSMQISHLITCFNRPEIELFQNNTVVLNFQVCSSPLQHLENAFLKFLFDYIGKRLFLEKTTVL